MCTESDAGVAEQQETGEGTISRWSPSNGGASLHSCHDFTARWALLLHIRYCIFFFLRCTVDVGLAMRPRWLGIQNSLVLCDFQPLSAEITGMYNYAWLSVFIHAY